MDVFNSVAHALHSERSLAETGRPCGDGIEIRFQALPESMSGDVERPTDAIPSRMGMRSSVRERRRQRVLRQTEEG